MVGTRWDAAFSRCPGRTGRTEAVLGWLVPAGMQHPLDAPAGPAPLPPPDGPVDTDGHENDGEQESAEDAAQQHCGEKRKNIN